MIKEVKIFLFRHGETDWNKNKELKYCEENHNVYLNDLGREQAKKLANTLKDKNIEYIYTSKLKRANETGKIVAEFLGVDFESVDGLQEFSIYHESVIGLTRQEIKNIIGLEKWDEFRKEKDAFLNERLLEGCETKIEVRKRIVNTIKNICKNTQHNIIGIASHGNIMLELLRELNFQYEERLKNCEVVELDFKNDEIIPIQRIKIEL